MSGGGFPGRILRRATCTLCRLVSQLPRMRFDDFPAATDGRDHALAGLRPRLRLERCPLRLELPQGGGIEYVVDTMTVAFERCAERIDIDLNLRDPLLFGTQGIAFLLDDLVDALVLAAKLLEQLLELRGIFNGLRCELPYTAGRALDDQRRHPIWVIDQGKRLRQVSRIAAQSGHGQQCRAVARRSAKRGEIDRPRVDELCHALLRGPFEARRRFEARGTGSGSRNPQAGQ